MTLRSKAFSPGVRQHAVRARLFAVVSVFASSVANEREAYAEPQVSIGVMGGAVMSEIRGPDLKASFPHFGALLGIRGDVLLGRSNGRSFGVGPFVDVSTARFDDIQLTGGVSALLPLFSALPIVLSGGLLARSSARGLESAWMTEIFFGSRSYNFHSIYNMTNGIFFSYRSGIGGSAQGDMILGLRIDGEIIALPFLLLRGAFKSTPP